MRPCSKKNSLYQTRLGEQCTGPIKLIQWLPSLALARKSGTNALHDSLTLRKACWGGVVVGLGFSVTWRKFPHLKSSSCTNSLCCHRSFDLKNVSLFKGVVQPQVMENTDPLMFSSKSCVLNSSQVPMQRIKACSADCYDCWQNLPGLYIKLRCVHEHWLHGNCCYKVSVGEIYLNTCFIAKHKLPNDWCIYYYKTNKLFDGIALQIIS